MSSQRFILHAADGSVCDVSAEEFLERAAPDLCRRLRERYSFDKLLLHHVARRDLELMQRYVVGLSAEALEDSIFPFCRDDGLLTICKADAVDGFFYSLDKQNDTLTLMYNHMYAETDAA